MAQRLAACVAVVWLLLLGGLSPIRAQQPGPAPEPTRAASAQGVIEDIRVEGNQRIEVRDDRAATWRCGVGDPFDPASSISR